MRDFCFACPLAPSLPVRCEASARPQAAKCTRALTGMLMTFTASRRAASISGRSFFRDELIYRLTSLYPKNFIGVCQLPQSPGVNPKNWPDPAPHPGRRTVRRNHARARPSAAMTDSRPAPDCVKLAVEDVPSAGRARRQGGRTGGAASCLVRSRRERGIGHAELRRLSCRLPAALVSRP